MDGRCSSSRVRAQMHRGDASVTLCPICGTVLGEPTVHAPDRLHGGGDEHQVARCPSCGAGVTLPRVSDERLSEFYPSDYGPYDERMNAAERAVSTAIRAFQGWNALRSAPLDALRGRRPGRGLDVGCGRGDLAAALAGHGWTMSGVEPSPAACAAAAIAASTCAAGPCPRSRWIQRPTTPSSSTIRSSTPTSPSPRSVRRPAHSRPEAW